MTNPLEQKTPRPTPEQLVVLLRHRFSKEQLQELRAAINNPVARKLITEALDDRQKI